MKRPRKGIVLSLITILTCTLGGSPAPGAQAYGAALIRVQGLSSGLDAPG